MRALSLLSTSGSASLSRFRFSHRKIDIHPEKEKETLFDVCQLIIIYIQIPFGGQK